MAIPWAMNLEKIVVLLRMVLELEIRKGSTAQDSSFKAKDALNSVLVPSRDALCSK